MEALVSGALLRARRSYSPLNSARREIDSVDAFVRALDARREQAGITKADLAKRVGMSPEVVRRLITASDPNPTLDTVVRLAVALDCNLGLEPRVSGRARFGTGGRYATYSSVVTRKRSSHSINTRTRGSSGCASLGGLRGRRGARGCGVRGKTGGRVSSERTWRIESATPSLDDQSKSEGSVTKVPAATSQARKENSSEALRRRLSGVR